jgi:hypothetical protein
MVPNYIIPSEYEMIEIARKQWNMRLFGIAMPKNLIEENKIQLCGTASKCLAPKFLSGKKLII